MIFRTEPVISFGQFLLKQKLQSWNKLKHPLPVEENV
jgi:hypothetical protein